MKSYIVLGMMLAAGLFAGCSGDKPGKRTVHHVMCVRPLPSDTETVRTFSGSVKEMREISLGFKTPGQIRQVYVKEGDRVGEPTIGWAWRHCRCRPTSWNRRWSG